MSKPKTVIIITICVLIAIAFYWQVFFAQELAFVFLTGGTIFLYFAAISYSATFNEPGTLLPKSNSLTDIAKIFVFLVYIYGCFSAFKYHIIAGVVYSAIWFRAYIGYFDPAMLKTDPKKDVKTNEEIIAEKADEVFYRLSSKSLHKPFISVLVGGSGFNLDAGSVYYLAYTQNEFIICHAIDDIELALPLNSIIAADITGPGTEVTNAGMIGGGVGLGGAVAGILAASAINAATTRKKTNTFLRIATSYGEGLFHFNDREPDELRLALSPVFVAVEANRNKVVASPSLTQEIEKLHKLKEQGVISEEEFSIAKRRLLN